MSTLKIIALTLLTVISMLCAANWPAFRANMQRTGYIDEDVLIPQDNAKWIFGPVGPIISSPSVMNGIVVFGCRDSCIYALDAKTGTLIWKKKTWGYVDCSPLIMNNKVVIGSFDNRVYVFDLTTGDSLDMFSSALPVSSPAASASGTIYMGSGYPHNLFAELQPGLWESQRSVYFIQPVYSSPALFKDSIAVIASNDGNLQAVLLSDFQRLWTIHTEGGCYLSSPAVDEDVVYFAPGDYDPNVYAIDVFNGADLWTGLGKKTLAKARIDAASHIPAMLLIELRRQSPEYRKAFFTYMQRHGDAFASGISLKKGARNAESNFQPSGGGLKTSSVAVDSLQVYVIQREFGYTKDIAMEPQSSYSVIAFDKFTGAENWRFQVIRDGDGFAYSSSPAVTRKAIFFGLGNKAYALDKTTKEILWDDSLDGNIISSPAIADSMLFVATDKGLLYAYKLNDTPQPASFKDGTYSYPNPAKTVAQIQYFPEKAGYVEVRIYDTAERMVKYFNRSGLPARVKAQFDWDVSNAANGVYFAQLKINYSDKTMDKKIIKIAVIKGSK